jgi:hypothetical protein
LVTIYTTCKFFMIWLRYVYYLQFISQLLIKKQTGLCWICFGKELWARDWFGMVLSNLHIMCIKSYYTSWDNVLCEMQETKWCCS